MSRAISFLLLVLCAISPLNQTYAQAQCNERLIVTIGDNKYFDFGFTDIDMDLGESLTIELPESIGPYSVNLNNAEDFSLSTSPSNLSITALSEGGGTLTLTSSSSSVDLRFNYSADPSSLSSSSGPIATGLFEGGLSFDGGLNYGRTNDFLFLIEPYVNRSEEIHIGGVLCPLTQHVGELGDIYVLIEIENNDIYALNSESKLVLLPSTSGLPPYRAGIELKENLEMKFFEGSINESMEEIKFTISYSLAEGDGTIYYEQEGSFSFKVN